MRTFLGYRRPDGQVGIRNHVLVIPANGYASTVAERIARLVPGVIAITHPHGAAQLGEDTRLTEWTLAGAAANPNVGAALLVGLDGEQGEAERVRSLASQRSPGKRYEAIAIQDEGGSIRAIRRGCAIAKDLLRHVAGEEAERSAGWRANPGDPMWRVGFHLGHGVESDGRRGLGLVDRAGRYVHSGGDTGVDGSRAYLGAARPQ